MTQRLLYGAAPYDDVIAYADALAAEAERLGAARGRAFALTLRGEAELLAGRLAGAERDLACAGELHHAIAAPTGEALTLQRRAEVALHDGRHADAHQLLHDALAVAEESSVQFHLLDRIYGTAIRAATDPDTAMTLVDDAEQAIRGPFETCPGCRITYTAPAAIASARAGDLERAATYADTTATLARVVMQLPAWDATVEEVRAHLARARGDRHGARDHFAPRLGALMRRRSLWMWRGARRWSSADRPRQGVSTHAMPAPRVQRRGDASKNTSGAMVPAKRLANSSMAAWLPAMRPRSCCSAGGGGSRVASWVVKSYIGPTRASR